MRHCLMSVAVLPLMLIGFAAPAAAASPDSKACSNEATAKGLTGSAREAFRSACLKSGTAAAPAKPTVVAAPAKPVSAPATTSKACSNEATAKGLTGSAREAFRSSCLKGTAPAAAVKPAAKPAAPAVPKPAATKPAAAPAVKPAAVSTAAPKSAASQSCSSAADARGLHGAEREAFRSNCLKGATPAKAVAPPARPVAKTVAPPEPGSVAAKAGKPSAPGTRTPAQLAADQRIHACGQQWQAAKAAGRLPAGATWPQYWSACSDRMKAAGK